MDLGRELRNARIDRGLSLSAVGLAVGISGSQTSRIERGLSARVSVWHLSRLFAAVGLELSVRAYPGGQPVRDMAQVALLRRFRTRLHRSLGWANEVPLPIAADQRAWDGVISGAGWRYGVEAETTLRDVQAMLRRLALKRRDGGMDGIVLLLPDTRRIRAVLREVGNELSTSFPVAGNRALELFGAGADPRGSAVIIL